MYIRRGVWHVPGIVYNDTYGYAGDPDNLIQMTPDDTPMVLDLKSNDATKRSYFAQVQAYSNAEYVIDDAGERKPMPRLDGEPLPCALLHVTPERAGLRIVEGDWFNQLFLPSLEVWQANNEIPMPKEKTVWDKWEL